MLQILDVRYYKLELFQKNVSRNEQSVTRYERIEKLVVFLWEINIRIMFGQEKFFNNFKYVATLSQI